jgi:hypothetical protein
MYAQVITVVIEFTHTVFYNFTCNYLVWTSGTDIFLFPISAENTDRFLVLIVLMLLLSIFLPKFIYNLTTIH